MLRCERLILRGHLLAGTAPGGREIHLRDAVARGWQQQQHWENVGWNEERWGEISAQEPVWRINKLREVGEKRGERRDGKIVTGID